MQKEPDRNPRKALGKGLSALLSARSGLPAIASDPAPTLEARRAIGFEAQAHASLPPQFEEFQSIALEQIQPGEEQPRSSFDPDKLLELAESIRVNGVLQPITVQRTGPHEFKIIAGERRWKAAGLAGLSEIPALVRSMEAHQRLEMALIENIQREDLNPIEIANAFARLAEEHGLNHEEIAKRTGKDRSTVTNLLRLLRLSPFVRDTLAAGRISVGHARALLALTDEAIQEQICSKIEDQQLSVRATEEIVKEITTAPAESSLKRKEPKEPPKLDANVRAALDEMEMALGTTVRLISRSGASGRLEIEYYSQDDLDRIYSVIVKQ